MRQRISGWTTNTTRSLGISALLGLLTLPAQAGLFVASTGGTVTEIDETLGSTLNSFNNGSNGVGIEVDLTNSFVYLSRGNTHVVTRSNLDGSSPTNLLSTADSQQGGTGPGNERLDHALDVAGNRIFVATGNGQDIISGALDGSGAPSILFENIGGATSGVEYHAGSDQVFWTNHSSGIWTGNADGSGAASQLFTGSGFRQLAIDPLSSTIYWTDRSNGRILSGLITGGPVTTVFSGLSTPYGIDVDPSTGTLYFSETGGAIYRGNTDGTGLTQIATLSNPRGVSIGIPEPGTPLMIFCGLAGLVFGTRRRKRS